MTRRVAIVGIGTGDPEHLTLGAVRALNQTDVVFLVDKGDASAELRNVRLALCERVIDPAHRYRVVDVELPAVRERDAAPYRASVSAWRAARAAAYERLIAELDDHETGAFLVWGDPALYDGTLAVLDDVRAGGRVTFDIEVIPGISSISALAARHRVPLNRTGEAILITTGRHLARDGLPDGVENVVVMLDAHDAYRTLEDELDIWWGASLGLPHQRLVAGRLGDQRDEITRQRAETRAHTGWLFDTYLLRRPAP